MNLENRIKELIPHEGEYLLGFADLRDVPAHKYKGYDYAIVIGKKLADRIVAGIVSGPNQEYLDHYHETNGILSGLSRRISRELAGLDIANIVIEPTVADRDLDSQYYKTLRCDFSHKTAASRAGLGWIGKTALLITEEFGPRLRLATILTSRPLDCSKEPINESRCGSCSLCVEKCPAGAANGRLWNIHVDRDEFFDAFKCREKCIELSRQNLGQATSVCGICMSVCPVGLKKK